MIPWKMFGSNGHIQQPSPVIENFTKRKTSNTRINGKCIIKGSKLTWLQVHVSNCLDGHTINTRGDVITDYCDQPIDEKSLSEYSLHLNHYFLQSYEWFMNIKATRGDAVTENNPRDINYFMSCDNNDYLDTELSDKIY